MNKKIKNIIILLTILLVVLIIFLIFFQKKKFQSSEVRLEDIKNDKWNDEVVYPDGMPKLFRNYSGEMNAINIGKSMYYVTTIVIPKYYTSLKTATDTQVSEYYNQNLKEIMIDIGINDEQDFKKFIATIQNLTTNKLTLNSFRIDKDKIDKKSSYTKTTLYITYEGNDEIGFNVKICNSVKKDTSSLIYTALESK